MMLRFLCLLVLIALTTAQEEGEAAAAAASANQHRDLRKEHARRVLKNKKNLVYQARHPDEAAKDDVVRFFHNGERVYPNK